MAVHTWTVDELCGAVAITLEEAFPDELWVRGEITGLRRSPAGHMYFDMIEPGAQGRGADIKISVVAFRGPLRGIEAVLAKVGNLQLEDGIEVRIRGRIEYYPPQGRVQFLMNAIDPRYTLGQLAADRDRVLRALAADGLIERNQRLPLPLVPLRVGLVTSDDSAAYNDFVEELAGSGFAFHVLVADARVQGLEAEASLVAALTELSRLELDAIAMVRGGGAKTDLVAFDRETVARAVATSRHPVLVGIGHEIDRSVTDEVAHASLKTPTACAGALIDRVAAFHRRIDELGNSIASQAMRALAAEEEGLRQRRARVGRATRGALRACEQNIHAAELRLARSSIRALDHAALTVAHLGERVTVRAGRELDHAEAAASALAQRITTAARRTVREATRHLDAAAAVVNAVHPDRTLARGFSITRTPDGRRLTELPNAGDPLVTETALGEIASTVTSASGLPSPVAATEAAAPARSSKNDEPSRSTTS